MLEVRLLGGFQISRGKSVISISSRPAQSLFAFLILNAGTAYRREKLAGLLWPDSTEERARDYLRHALWRVRRALETASSARYLQADDLTVAFRAFTDYHLDVAALRDIGQAASADELMTALAAYKGELLPGFYDEWLVLEREHLSSIFEQQMARLLSLLHDERRWLDVLDWGERWIKLGQTPEPAYRALMSAFAARGDMSKVAATYERCQQSLRDLGFEPSEQTRELYKSLKAGKDVPEARPANPPGRKREPTPNTNLPIPLTSFVGRKKEIGTVIGLLERNRLVSLTGTGGVGKTRLVIECASRVLSKYKDGVWWVDLVGVNDPTSVPHAVAQAALIAEVPGRPLLETLVHTIQSKRMLLVLDNCEHLVAACSQVATRLLSDCPNLRILATSREALGIEGEAAWHVPSLSLPASQGDPSLETLQRSESVLLFSERAALIQHNYRLTDENAGAVAQICFRLGGIPLAIELAAARVRMMTPQEIAQLLDRRFDLLTAGSRTASPRHQTLRAAIDWSYELLSPPERILFRRLAVFAGGFTLEAAASCCLVGDLKPEDVFDLLGRLVDKSLVSVDAGFRGGQTRYRLLETLREYGLEKLAESGEEHSERDQHMIFFGKLAAEAEARLLGAQTLLWVDRLQAEHDNLMAAIDWSLSTGSLDSALRIVGALAQWDAWHNREGAERSLQVVQSPLAHARTPLRARALRTAGIMQWFQGDRSKARALLQEAVDLGQECGDIEIYVWALGNLANVEAGETSFEAAREHLEQGLAAARKLGTQGRATMGFSLAFLGDVFIAQNDREKARQAYQEAVVWLRELHNVNFLGYPLRRLADLALDSGDYEAATALCTESMSLNVAQGDQRAILACLAGFAAIVAERGGALDAVRLYAAVDDLLARSSDALVWVDQQAYDRNVARLRSRLEGAVFDAAWAKGRALGLDQAIALVSKAPERAETQKPRSNRGNRAKASP